LIVLHCSEAFVTGRYVLLRFRIIKQSSVLGKKVYTILVVYSHRWTYRKITKRLKIVPTAVPVE
jgi:hypothetical protein